MSISTQTSSGQQLRHEMLWAASCDTMIHDLLDDDGSIIHTVRRRHRRIQTEPRRKGKTSPAATGQRKWSEKECMKHLIKDMERKQKLMDECNLTRAQLEATEDEVVADLTNEMAAKKAEEQASPGTNTSSDYSNSNSYEDIEDQFPESYDEYDEDFLYNNYEYDDETEPLDYMHRQWAAVATQGRGGPAVTFTDSSYKHSMIECACRDLPTVGPHSSGPSIHSGAMFDNPCVKTAIATASIIRRKESRLVDVEVQSHKMVDKPVQATAKRRNVKTDEDAAEASARRMVKNSDEDNTEVPARRVVKNSDEENIEQMKKKDSGAKVKKMIRKIKFSKDKSASEDKRSEDMREESDLASKMRQFEESQSVVKELELATKMKAIEEHQAMLRKIEEEYIETEAMRKEKEVEAVKAEMKIREVEENLAARKREVQLQLESRKREVEMQLEAKKREIEEQQAMLKKMEADYLKAMKDKKEEVEKAISQLESGSNDHLAPKSILKVGVGEINSDSSVATLSRENLESTVEGRNVDCHEHLGMQSLTDMDDDDMPTLLRNRDFQRLSDTDNRAHADIMNEESFGIDSPSMNDSRKNKRVKISEKTRVMNVNSAENCSFVGSLDMHFKEDESPQNEHTEENHPKVIIEYNEDGMSFGVDLSEYDVSNSSKDNFEEQNMNKVEEVTQNTNKDEETSDPVKQFELEKKFFEEQSCDVLGPGYHKELCDNDNHPEHVFKEISKDKKKRKEEKGEKKKRKSEKDTVKGEEPKKTGKDSSEDIQDKKEIDNPELEDELEVDSDRRLGKPRWKKTVVENKNEVFEESEIKNAYEGQVAAGISKEDQKQGDVKVPASEALKSLIRDKSTTELKKVLKKSKTNLKNFSRDRLKTAIEVSADNLIKQAQKNKEMDKQLLKEHLAHKSAEKNRRVILVDNKDEENAILSKTSSRIGLERKSSRVSSKKEVHPKVLTKDSDSAMRLGRTASRKSSRGRVEYESTVETKTEVKPRLHKTNISAPKSESDKREEEMAAFIKKMDDEKFEYEQVKFFLEQFLKVARRSDMPRLRQKAAEITWWMNLHKNATTAELGARLLEIKKVEEDHYGPDLD